MSTHDSDYEISDDEFGDTVENPDPDDPQLEFDETALELSANADSLIITSTPHIPSYFPATKDLESCEDSDDEGAFRNGAITPDGLIDEDFEKELGSPGQEVLDDGEFSDIARHGIIEVAGDDVYGRKVIVFSSCRLPNSQDLDQQRLLQYIRYTLDQYVESDYSLVYFHYGLSSKNKPRLAWLFQAYKDFDRKYKKNLKALYLVHPTKFIRVLFKIFKPFISVKFGRKVMYVNYLHELNEHLHFDQLIVPQPVLKHNARLLQNNKPIYPYEKTDANDERLPTQQFGVPIEFIQEHQKCVIPPIVEQTILYITENGLDEEGLFRRTANSKILRETKVKINNGETVDFGEAGDIHVPAVILKSFLRDLPEPLLTFELYETVARLQNMEPEQQVKEAKRIMKEELPQMNYVILKYIMSFLTKVMAHSEQNRMSPQNLALVFGPNMLWSKGQTSLSTINVINHFMCLLLEHNSEIFGK